MEAAAIETAPETDRELRQHIYGAATVSLRLTASLADRGGLHEDRDVLLRAADDLAEKAEAS